MKNKSVRFVTLLLAAGFMANSLAFAGRGMGCCGDCSKMDRKMDKKMGKFGKKLNLTDDQKAEMQKAAQDKREKMQQIQSEHEEKIMGILNEEQKTKYKGWKGKKSGKWNKD